MLVHYGTASAERANLTIEWPSGIRQTLADIPVDQRITVVEPSQH